VNLDASPSKHASITVQQRHHYLLASYSVSMP